MDYMLQGAMDFLDVNDLASVNLVLAESSAIHVELVSKMKKLKAKATRRTAKKARMEKKVNKTCKEINMGHTCKPWQEG